MSIRGVVAMIDDDSRVREAVESLLIAQGFDVELYASAEDFLSARGYLMIDCIISDLGLPGMTGGDLALWMEKAHPQLPLILVSGQDPAVFGADSTKRAVLEKPFAAGQLVALLERALKVA